MTDGTAITDAAVCCWSMPWNVKPDASYLVAGIPNSSFWASAPGDIEQVGCIYTAQGFEYDQTGVIWGHDPSWRPGVGWVGEKTVSNDGVVKRSEEQFRDLVKNTYRVLPTRGGDRWSEPVRGHRLLFRCARATGTGLRSDG